MGGEERREEKRKKDVSRTEQNKTRKTSKQKRREQERMWRGIVLPSVDGNSRVFKSISRLMLMCLLLSLWCLGKEKKWKNRLGVEMGEEMVEGRRREEIGQGGRRIRNGREKKRNGGIG
jgi:hypothetical protein